MIEEFKNQITIDNNIRDRSRQYTEGIILIHFEF